MGRRPGQPKLEDAVWVALLERYVAGETQAALAIEHGVSISAIAWQARARGYRKRDRPGAVYRWVQPPPIVPAQTPEAANGFDFDPDDPLGSARRAREVGRRAAAEGRTLDFLRLMSAAKESERLEQPCRPHPVACGDRPPPRGEGEGVRAAPEPVLRAAQRGPAGAWGTWLFLGGRGAGKTLAGASWLADRAEALGPPTASGGGRLALIGPSLHDVREVMVEGPSGVLGLARWDDPRFGGRRPVYEAGRRRLVFPNGAVAQTFSAEDPDGLRGPQFAAAWADEWCAWRDGEGTLALLRMGLRLGPSPQLCVTTTPRPTGALRRLRAEPGLVETHAATGENAAHLAPGFLAGLEALYGGTRRAAQEIEGRVVETSGALFTAEMLARAREGVGDWGLGIGRDGPRRPATSPQSPIPSPPPFDRVVVAVDPTATAGGDACGIVVAGRSRRRGNDDVATVRVLADRTVAGVGPDAWGRRVARAVEDFGAACVVAEVNQGGDMVRAVLKASGCAVRVREVRATRGKRLRAEPVSALYEQGRVRHVAGLGRLEEELMALGVEGGRSGGEEGGLDRADALVWAVTDLLIDPAGAAGPPRVRTLDVPLRAWGLSAGT
jgi:phage terminase large subunit-like protein